MRVAFKTRYKPTISYDSPEALFHDLRTRSVEGLLSHQTDMLRRYMEEAFDKKDVAFELPTGSGKTLVGLLIGEFRRRTKGERVVYLCPTRQLVNQVVEQSRSKYGIKTLAFTGSKKDYSPEYKMEYNNSETIAVTTYSSLFNTNPFFSNPNLIILDDAHSSENYIASFWSLSISREKYKPLYDNVVEFLKPLISDAHYQRLVSDSPAFQEDFQWVDKVPTPLLINRLSELTSLLDVNTGETDLKYSWMVIRDHLHACHVYLSWHSILIRPVIPPSLTHPPFANATQRIYMSATLGAGGDLERITGISSIYRLPIPTGWDKQGVGRRFFIFPEAVLSESEALDFAIEAAKCTSRALVLVPDDKSVENVTEQFKTDFPDSTIFHAEKLEASKSDFIQTDKAVAILANRLDGIDLSGDECRLLIIKDLPKATNLQEKFLESRMAASILLQDRFRTRIIQAVGRCTRSATDYSAVCILGQELMDILAQKQNLVFFHPEFQGELTFGLAESKVAKREDFLENLKAFLAQGDEWQQADAEIVARRNTSKQKSSDAAGKLLKSARFEVEYQYAVWKEDYERALELSEKVLNILEGDDVKGYRGFWYYLAGSTAWLEYMKDDKAYAQVARERFKQAAACTDSVTWLRNLSKLEVEKRYEPSGDDYLAALIEGLETKLTKLGISSNNKFEQEVQFILTNLASQESKKFEEAHRRLGELLGYAAFNSDETAAPDPWWVLGDELCIVAEDKSSGDIVSVSDTRQAASHPNWIREKVPLAKNALIVPVMITTATTIDPAALPYVGDVLYWHIDEFRDWARKAIGVIRGLRTSFATPGDVSWRTKAIQEYKSAKIDPDSLLAGLRNHPLKNLTKSH